ncbi:hypothetical protein P3X46_026767 [Hevea brasiliensis]|uniref:Uncharacterized protein n=1 Tax=Hevea brasiliensis TaxID=3981 RepID=A0ABQ9KXQ9_HEVBR|nr:uncharacterized protein LOC110632245 [Hevea brasiliensis]KAJ9153317.1 hypothetical protein P3X46_026767 [Hevea brasiliensis]
MRVLFCKIHCPPFVCFCKPSSSIYTAGPLKLENSPQVPSTAVISVANASSKFNDHHVYSDSIGVKEESSEVDVDVDGKQSKAQNCLKSSLIKSDLDSKEVEKKRVQWMDFLGKELVEIREFESSETEDSDSEDESNRGCSCMIL